MIFTELALPIFGQAILNYFKINTVSIWGAIHTYAGFLGYGQNLAPCKAQTSPVAPAPSMMTNRVSSATTAA